MKLLDQAKKELRKLLQDIREKDSITAYYPLDSAVLQNGDPDSPRRLEAFFEKWFKRLTL